MDDILIFCDGSFRDVNVLSQGLEPFKRASGMMINEGKSIVTWENLDDHEIRILEELFNFNFRALDEGVSTWVFS